MENSRVEYKVIPEQRIVIAKINNIEDDAINFFNKKFLANITSSIHVTNNWYKDDEKFIMPRSLKCVARCHPDDVFDEEVGKRIALKKLSEKYNRCLDKHLAHFLVSFDKTLKIMDKYFEGREF